MKKHLAVMMVLLSVWLTGTACQINEEQKPEAETPVESSQDQEQQVEDQLAEPEEVGMANPASVYCQDQGGEYVAYQTEIGEAGYCQLPDGRVCEEWFFFNSSGEECQPLVEDEQADNFDQSQKQTETEVLNRLLEALDFFNQDSLQGSHFLWEIVDQDEGIVSMGLFGSSVTATDVDGEQIESVEQFFMEGGFVEDPLNAKDTGFRRMFGYQKDQMACLIQTEGTENTKLEVGCAEL